MTIDKSALPASRAGALQPSHNSKAETEDPTTSMATSLAASALASEIDADAFRRIYPDLYFDRFAEQGLRPDGRAFTECRELVVATDVIGSARGSALVKIGDTSMIAGVRLEARIVNAALLLPANNELLLSAGLRPHFRFPRPRCYRSHPRDWVGLLPAWR